MSCVTCFHDTQSHRDIVLDCAACWWNANPGGGSTVWGILGFRVKGLEFMVQGNALGLRVVGLDV